MQIKAHEEEMALKIREYFDIFEMWQFWVGFRKADWMYTDPKYRNGKAWLLEHIYLFYICTHCVITYYVLFDVYFQSQSLGPQYSGIWENPDILETVL